MQWWITTMTIMTNMTTILTTIITQWQKKKTSKHYCYNDNDMTTKWQQNDNDNDPNNDNGIRTIKVLLRTKHS